MSHEHDFCAAAAAAEAASASTAASASASASAASPKPDFPSDWAHVPAQVPPAYVGLWKRVSYVDEWMTDERTARMWLQTPHWHADLGIAADRPDFGGVHSIAQCSDAQLAWLCNGQGFFGVTRVSGDFCFWDRLWDFQLRDTPDIGQIQLDGDVLHEGGVFRHYREVWNRQAFTRPARELAFDAYRPGMPDIVLLACGGYFMYLRDRFLGAAPACRTRRQIAAGTASRSEMEAFADFDMSFGHYDDTCWTIDASTLPWREKLQVRADAQGLPDCAALVGDAAATWRPLGDGARPNAPGPG
jgi:hypothetical protein